MTERPNSPDEAEASGEPVVLIVDDDESMREGLEALFRSVGLRANVFASTSELMRSTLPNVPSCLVLDVRLPGVSGLDFQSDLAAAGIHIPIIFMTGHGDIPMSVQAMKAGAVDFLTKPFRHQEMIHAVNRALAADRKKRADQAIISQWRRLCESLTTRERQVFALVSAGLRNKGIAAELGISEITAKVHRVHLMRKMRARSLADLVRIADALGIHRDSPKGI
ncbi:MAG TPA: response regulator [Steroidobacteraceae bacterium]|nr:response regulator [Steroidobacteraceae bacterium]